MATPALSKMTTIIALSFVLIIDALVMGIVFPIMGALFLHGKQAIVSTDTPIAWRDVLYGIAMGIFFFCAIVGAPFLGELSDKWGRRKVLLLSLFINGMSCLLSAAAIGIKSPLLLIISRAVAGLSAGNQPLAQAAIIDISTPQTKARNLSLISLASSVGFIVGPLLGGVFSDTHLWHGFSAASPFQLAALLAFINALYLMLVFRETFHPLHQRTLQWWRGFTLLWQGFRHAQLGSWNIIFLIEQLAWGIYFQSVSLILIQVHHYSSAQTGLFIMLLSVVFAIALGLIIPLALKRWQIKTLLYVGLILVALSVFSIALLVHSTWIIWITEIPFGIGQALIYTSCITLISNAVTSEHQGWAMGVATATGSLAWGMAAVFSGLFINFAPGLPFLLAGLLFIGVIGLLRRKEVIHV